MTEVRKCQQCGKFFAPRREHARFCSARCRVAWNREQVGDPGGSASALSWSISAMTDTIDRLSIVSARNQPRAFAVIGEAVWWVTIVDATLVRYHPQIYDAVLARRTPARRQLIEGTLAGLRFVRNRMGYDADQVDFVRPLTANRGRGGDDITAWRWTSVPEPALDSLTPRARAWEMTRHQAYEVNLAGHTVGEVFTRAAEFLNRAAAAAPSLTAASARARQ